MFSRRCAATVMVGVEATDRVGMSARGVIRLVAAVIIAPFMPGVAAAQFHAPPAAPALGYVERNLPPQFPHWRSPIVFLQPSIHVVRSGGRIFVRTARATTRRARRTGDSQQSDTGPRTRR